MTWQTSAARAVLPLVLAAGMGLGCTAAIMGPSVASAAEEVLSEASYGGIDPEFLDELVAGVDSNDGVRLLSAAKDALAHNDSTSSATDDAPAEAVTCSSDHLGELRFGDLSVTIPDWYTCVAFQDHSSEDAAEYRASYTGSGVSVVVDFIHDDGVTDLVRSFGLEQVVPLIAQGFSDLSDLSPVKGYRLHPIVDSQGNAYAGLYTPEPDTSKGGVVIGCAVDGTGRLVIVSVTYSEARSDSFFDVIWSISGGIAQSPSPDFSTSSGLESDDEGYGYDFEDWPVGHTYGAWRALDDATLALVNSPDIAMSRESLVSYLIEQGVSEPKARYAVGRCGIDWSKQAVRTAKMYGKDHRSSRSELIDWLKSLGYYLPSQTSAAATASWL